MPWLAGKNGSQNPSASNQEKAVRACFFFAPVSSAVSLRIVSAREHEQAGLLQGYTRRLYFVLLEDFPPMWAATKMSPLPLRWFENINNIVTVASLFATQISSCNSKTSWE